MFRAPLKTYEKRYNRLKIRIIETLEKEFEIEAKNEKEALEKIQIAYDNEEIILYPEDLDHKEMKIVGYKDM